LRNSIDEEQKRAKISAIYNIFAFPVMVVLIMVLPRMTDSLHPGNGGNPAFGKLDMDNRMRIVLYPAFIAWSFIAIWIASLRYRIRLIEYKRNEIN
jgi:heme exporter protein C